MVFVLDQIPAIVRRTIGKVSIALFQFVLELRVWIREFAVAEDRVNTSIPANVMKDIAVKNVSSQLAPELIARFLQFVRAMVNVQM